MITLRQQIAIGEFDAGGSREMKVKQKPGEDLLLVLPYFDLLKPLIYIFTSFSIQDYLILHTR